MNLFCALLGSADDEATRERRLRDALRDPAATVRHPAAGASVGWCGTDVPVACITDPHGFGAVFGAGHVAPGFDGDSPVTVDDPAGLCAHLRARHAAGVPPLQGLAGSFIAIGHDQAGGTWVAGDPSGGRPAYTRARGRELAVANHPAACARLSGEPGIDRRYEDFLLVYGFLPEGRTVFRDVMALPAGQVLQSDGEGWARAAVPPPPAGSAYADVPESTDGLLDRLYEVMLRCLQEQLGHDEDVGVLLGGFDSALVASMLHRLGRRVHTYSFRYQAEAFNQPHTDTLAAFLGNRHTWVDITPDVIARGLSGYGEQYVQPTNWLNYVIQTTHVCERMRADGLRFAYSGDGCDAVFLGYPGTYQRTRAFARLPRLPGAVSSPLVAALGRPWLDRTLGHPYRVGMSLLRATARPMPTRAFLSFRVLDETSVRALRQGDRPAQAEDIEAMLARLASPHAGTSIQRLGYAAKALVSPNRAKMLAAADVAGVIVHAPYLHPGLKGFAAKIPDHLLRLEGESRLRDPGKACLMRMAERHGLLPSEVIHQPKLAAIDSPIDEWFAGPLRPALRQALAGLPFDPEPRLLEALIGTTAAERLYKRHLGSTRVISDAISLLATYGATCAAAGTADAD